MTSALTLSLLLLVGYAFGQTPKPWTSICGACSSGSMTCRTVPCESEPIDVPAVVVFTNTVPARPEKGIPNFGCGGTWTYSKNGIWKCEQIGCGEKTRILEPE